MCQLAICLSGCFVRDLFFTCLHLTIMGRGSDEYVYAVFIFNSSSRGLCLEQKKMKTVVEHPLGASTKIQKKEKSQVLDVNAGSSTWRKERSVGGLPGNQLGPAEKCKCDVCGTFSSASYNKLLCCGRCPVKVRELTWTWEVVRWPCISTCAVVFYLDGVLRSVAVCGAEWGVI